MKEKLFLMIVVAGLVTGPAAMAQAIDFGDDSSDYAQDGECHDKRFDGPGMTGTILLHSDIGRDATDCAKAFKAGTISLRQVATESLIIDQIDFGTDSSEWANDNECDDPRFEGPGMTSSAHLQEDTLRDASDCAKAYRAGLVELKTY